MAAMRVSKHLAAEGPGMARDARPLGVVACLLLSIGAWPWSLVNEGADDWSFFLALLLVPAFLILVGLPALVAIGALLLRGAIYAPGAIWAFSITGALGLFLRTWTGLAMAAAAAIGLVLLLAPRASPRNAPKV